MAVFVNITIIIVATYLGDWIGGLIALIVLTILPNPTDNSEPMGITESEKPRIIPDYEHNYKWFIKGRGHRFDRIRDRSYEVILGDPL